MTCFRRPLLILIFSLSLIAFTGCPDDGNGTNNGNDTNTTGSDTTTGSDNTLPDTNATGCDVNGFNAGGTTTNALFPAGTGFDLDEFVVVMRSQDGFPQDRLTFSRMGGSFTSTGTVSFTSDNYSTCATNDAANDGNFCATIHRECTGDMASSCNNEIFVTTGGELEVTSTGGAGDTFTATFRNVKLVEHTITPAPDNVATPAPDAEIWCLDGVSVTTSIVSP